MTSQSRRPRSDNSAEPNLAGLVKDQFLTLAHWGIRRPCRCTIYLYRCPVRGSPLDSPTGRGASVPPSVPFAVTRWSACRPGRKSESIGRNQLMQVFEYIRPNGFTSYNSNAARWCTDICMLDVHSIELLLVVREMVFAGLIGMVSPAMLELISRHSTL